MSDRKRSPTNVLLQLVNLVLFVAFIWAGLAALDRWGILAAIAVAAVWLSFELLLWRAIARRMGLIERGSRWWR